MIKRPFLSMALFGLILIMAAPAGAQDAPQNLKVFPEGTGKQELIGVMKQWTQALGVRCDHCHVQAVPGDFQSFDFPSDEKPAKLTARGMMQMVQNLNFENFGGGNKISCVTCHRGLTNPATIDRVMIQTVDGEGTPTALERYRKLYDRYLGSGSYDFRPRALLPVVETLAGREGGIDEALLFVAMAIELNPEDVDTHIVQAHLLMQKGDSEGAGAAVEKALELDPGNKQAERLRSQLEG